LDVETLAPLTGPGVVMPLGMSGLLKARNVMRNMKVRLGCVLEKFVLSTE
jgi:hypothetical protein